MDERIKRKKGWASAVLSLFALGILAFLLIPFYNLWVSEFSGPYFNSTAVADFEGDGDLDVVVMNLRKEGELTFWHVLTFWTNQGGGRFSPEGIDLGPFLYLTAAAGDVDRDGDDDVAVLSVPNMVLYLNQGGIQEGDPADFKIGQSISPREEYFTISSVELADLNGDGNLDAFIAGCSGSLPGKDGILKGCTPARPWVWINTGGQGGRLGSQVLSQAGIGELRIHDFALGDLDGDSDLDVFAALVGPQFGERTESPDRVFLNDGSGNFHDSGQQLGKADSYAVALGDLDGDDDLDALAGSDRTAQVWTNQGGAQGGQPGEFAAGLELAGDGTVDVFLADLNSDGYTDALVAGIERAAIWWNDGQGGFNRSFQRFRYSERHALALGDFNGDGHLDFFAAQYGWGHRVWHNDGEGRFK